MTHQHSFDFLDPSDVLRGCHIIPSFQKGKKHPEGLGVSGCAGDSHDWREYFVNRFVDRDMLMRFHFGLGVGHVYSHYRGAPAGLQPEVSTHDISDEDENDEDADDYGFESEDEGISRVEAVGERFGDSDESLLEQFADMYESDVDLDYEN
ncbi:hypothetical protein EDD22DRAFT_959142 [Suillus occidentalis]|nr:hypothetical protein EDD22DRAFT_959142 [Suillus occidentalis]